MAAPVVREPANVIERAAILARGNRLAIDAVLPEPGRETPGVAIRASPGGVPQTPKAGAIETETERRARERANLVAALERSDWKVVLLDRLLPLTLAAAIFWPCRGLPGRGISAQTKATASRSRIRASSRQLLFLLRLYPTQSGSGVERGIIRRRNSPAENGRATGGRSCAHSSYD